MALTDDLISHWSLEQASGTRTDDHGSNSLTEENAVTVNSATGKVSNGAAFVGPSFTGLGKADGTWLDSITNKASLQMWVKPSDGGMDKDPGGIRFGLEIQQVGAFIQVECATGGVGGFVGGVFATGTWAHIIALYDGAGATNADRLKCYVNGSAVSLSYSGSIPTTMNTGAGFHLGSNGNSADWWSGVLDQVMLAARVWTTDEITFLYNGGAGRTYAEIGTPPTVNDYRIIPPTLNFIQPAGQLAIVPATA